MNANPKSVLFEEALTRSVIGAFYDVHRVLGFGFREHIYALALQRDLLAKGHRVDREAAVTVELSDSNGVGAETSPALRSRTDILSRDLREPP
jgi:hypothetical protein